MFIKKARIFKKLYILVFPTLFSRFSTIIKKTIRNTKKQIIMTIRYYLKKYSTAQNNKNIYL